MKKILSVIPLALAFVLVAACGPSSAELKTAHATTYKAPPATLFATAKAALEANSNRIHIEDPDALRLETEGLWYTPEGQLDTTTGNNIARLQEDSINLAFSVQLTKTDGDAYKLDVTPIIGRKHGLVSTPEKVDPSDPSLPGWIAGKTDALDLKVYDHLKAYATASTTSTPAAAPAAAPAPAPAPTPTPTPTPEPTPTPAPAPAPAPAP